MTGETTEEEQVDVDEKLQEYTVMLAKHAMRISQSLHRALPYFVEKGVSDRSILAISILMYVLDQVMKMMQDLKICTSYVSDEEIKVLSDKIKRAVH